MISGALELLKFDLQRNGVVLGDDVYLTSLLNAAQASITRQGIAETADEDYIQAVVGTAAWMYRKRVTGEAEPAYLKRLRLDLLASQKMGGG
nr:MAG TPA_asm: head-tail connector protein [Caudoviricetes sp.]